ncbi:MAG: hypothetical protein IK077_10595 [Thermoguttaceae bacterium]|nr:hypothetical protein [Thermoguttaceae bacterium]
MDLDSSSYGTAAIAARLLPASGDAAATPVADYPRFARDADCGIDDTVLCGIRVVCSAIDGAAFIFARLLPASGDAAATPVADYPRYARDADCGSDGAVSCGIRDVCYVIDGAVFIFARLCPASDDAAATPVADYPRFARDAVF